MDPDNSKWSLSSGNGNDDDAKPRTDDREAAAEVMRDSIDRIYETDPPNKTKEQERAHQAGAPYNKTHDPNAISYADNSKLHEYHSAWQNYYKQYYERYYMQQVEAMRNRQNPGSQSQNPVSNSQSPKYTDELKDELVAKIKDRAGKVRRSSHFWPLVAAISIGLLVLFAQYNRVVFAQVRTFISPGSVETQNIILDPVTNTKVGPEPKIIIPKINVDAPVVYGVGSLQENPIQNALKNGVVHYPLPGANSVPGQVGNTVILGHSSNDVFDAGAYKFVFVLLDRLDKGDTFYINHDGTRYTYTVTEKKIIDPTEVSSLVINTDRPLATLVTCTPPGTALKRLVVTAEQVSPDPIKAAAAPSQEQQLETDHLPGNSPTIFERLFGIGI